MVSFDMVWFDREVMDHTLDASQILDQSQIDGEHIEWQFKARMVVTGNHIVIDGWFGLARTRWPLPIGFLGFTDFEIFFPRLMIV